MTDTQNTPEQLTSQLDQVDNNHEQNLRDDATETIAPTAAPESSEKQPMTIPDVATADQVAPSEWQLEKRETAASFMPELTDILDRARALDPSRSTSLVETKAEEAVMWLNAYIQAETRSASASWLAIAGQRVMEAGMWLDNALVPVNAATAGRQTGGDRVNILRQGANGNDGA